MEDTAVNVFLSPLFLQQGFLCITGLSIGEYPLNRRLSEAAKVLKKTPDRIPDIAIRHG